MTCAWVHGRERIFNTIVMILKQGGHGIDFHYTQSSHLGKKLHLNIFTSNSILKSVTESKNCFT